MEREGTEIMTHGEEEDGPQSVAEKLDNLFHGRYLIGLQKRTGRDGEKDLRKCRDVEKSETWKKK